MLNKENNRSKKSIQYKEEYVKSTLPYYVVGVLWLLWAVVLPMYKLSHFLILILISGALFMIVKKITPDVKVRVPIVEVPIKTGNAELDEMMITGKKYLSQIKSANERIMDKYISAQITRMESTTDKIFKYISENPKDILQIRRFMNYYLPTLLKLLNTYISLSSEGGTGKNVTDSMERIKNVLSTIADAFDKQLDNLYMAKALDISTDIRVLEGILSQEGLKNDSMSGK